METWYEATCIQQFQWKMRSFGPGDPIKVIEKDMQKLFQAGLIGAMKKVESKEPGIEQAVREAPENEMKSYHRKARP